MRNDALYPYALPSPDETARLVAEARRMRARAFADMLRSVFRALVRLAGRPAAGGAARA